MSTEPKITFVLTDNNQNKNHRNQKSNSSYKKDHLFIDTNLVTEEEINSKTNVLNKAKSQIKIEDNSKNLISKEESYSKDKVHNKFLSEFSQHINMKSFNKINFLESEIKANQTDRNLINTKLSKNDYIKIMVENKNLKLINDKIIADSNLKSDIIKKLNNENFLLKNELLNLKSQLANVINQVRNEKASQISNIAINNLSKRNTNKANEVSSYSSIIREVNEDPNSSSNLPKISRNMFITDEYCQLDSSKNTFNNENSNDFKISKDTSKPENFLKQNKDYANLSESFNLKHNQSVKLKDDVKFNDHGFKLARLTTHANIIPFQTTKNSLNNNSNPLSFKTSMNSFQSNFVKNKLNLVNKVSPNNKLNNLMTELEMRYLPVQKINFDKGYLTSRNYPNFIKPSSIFSHSGISFYNDFKMNSIENNLRNLDSIMVKVNGNISLLKYTKENIINYYNEMSKFTSKLSSFENFKEVFISDKRDEEKEELYYNIRCLYLDFKTILNHQIINNKLLKTQQKLSGKYDINQIFSVISNSALSIINCEKIIVFLYNKKQIEFFTKLNNNKTKELKLDGKEGFIKNVIVDGKILVIDQAMNHPDFPKSFKTIDKILDLKTSSVMIVPIFYYNQEKNKSKKSNTSVYNNSFYRKLIGIIYFVNKKENEINEVFMNSNTKNDKDTANLSQNNKTLNLRKTIHHKTIKQNLQDLEISKNSQHRNSMYHSNNSGGSKTGLSINNENVSNDNFNKSSFTSDDESVAYIFSKQASSLISFSYDLNLFNNQEYKLNKALHLVQRLLSEKKDLVYSIVVSSIKKIFLTDYVQVIVPNYENVTFSDKEESGLKSNKATIESSKEKEVKYTTKEMVTSFKRIIDGNESKINKLSGIIGHVFNSKLSSFVNECKNNMHYNPMIDLEGCSILYTFPILNNDLKVIVIFQFEYTPFRVPWENDGIIHSLFPFDNDIIEMISPTISKVLSDTSEC